MDNIERFTDLLSGKLDEEAERKLFSEMSADDDLRNEYKCFHSVDSSIRQNMASFAPADAVKSRIFARAGFAMPNEIPVPVNNAPQPPSAASGFLRGRMFVSLASGAASAIVAVLLTMQLITTTDKPRPAGNQTIITEKFNTDIPKVESRSNDVIPEKVRTVVKYVYLDKEENTVSMEGRTARTFAIRANPEVMHNDFPIKTNKTGTPNGLSLNINQAGQYNAFVTRPINDPGLSAEFNGTMSWNNPKESITPSEYNKFNNLDVSLLYKPSDMLKAGLNLRQETFFTVYEGTEADGSTYRYRQQPNLTTVGALIRLSPITYYSISPWAQLAFGANQAGYVGGATLGFEYQAYPDLSFLLGFEYRQLWFTYQGTWFEAGKKCLNYGVAYKF